MARLLPLLLLMLAAAGAQAKNSSVPDSTEVKDKDGSKGNTEEGTGKGSGVIGKQLAARHLDLMLANYDRHLRCDPVRTVVWLFAFTPALSCLTGNLLALLFVA